MLTDDLHIYRRDPSSVFLLKDECFGVVSSKYLVITDSQTVSGGFSWFQMFSCGSVFYEVPSSS